MPVTRCSGSMKGIPPGVWLERKAKLTGCFIYASCAWLADDYRGTNDESRRLVRRIHERFSPNRTDENLNPTRTAKGTGA